jgi:transcription elongation factor GreA
MAAELMTAGGHARLEEEIGRLKREERPAVINAISTAREHGDLKENAEYHAAKERQAIIEARISELADKLKRAEIVDISNLSGDEVVFGAIVTLIDDDTERESTYQIVGSEEADIKGGLLSVTSPLARALIGRAKGDPVEVATPNGEKNYEILKIAFS